jgi:glycine cleavage system H protein
VSTIPEDLLYTAAHEYVRFRPDGLADVGITDYAQGALGDIIYVDLPKVGTTVTTSSVCGTLEAVKAVSELFSPVTGEVVAVNDQVTAEPAVLNRDPYGAGWMLRVRVANPASRDGLLSAAQYAKLVGE